jgi:hypothetical protein
VQHLVGFEIKRPIANAVEQRDGFLLAVDKTAHAVIAAHPLVPLRRDDADFRIADGAHHFFRVVSARAERDDKLVHQGQNRTDGGDKRIAELLPVAKKSESADFHARKLIRPPGFEQEK